MNQGVFPFPSGAAPAMGMAGLTPILYRELEVNTVNVLFDVPQNFRHLMMMFMVRSNKGADDNDVLNLRFNSDSRAVYYYNHSFMRSTNSYSATDGIAQTSGMAAWMSASTATANFFYTGTLLLPFYTGAAAKNWESRGAQIRNTVLSGYLVNTVNVGVWNSIEPIRQIEFFSAVGAALVPRCAFSLYGMG